MYLMCIPHVSGLHLQIHVSLMYPACILHLRYVPPWIHREVCNLACNSLTISYVSGRTIAILAHVGAVQAPRHLGRAAPEARALGCANAGLGGVDAEHRIIGYMYWMCVSG
jgi:hypothetical protein